VSSFSWGRHRGASGGHAIDRAGYFFEPTILPGLTDGTRIVDEEQFGPALPVISYRNEGDAIDRANTTHFGLSGSVWSADANRAPAVAVQLECGTAWIDTHLAHSPQQPFGGSSGAVSASRTALGPGRIHGVPGPAPVEGSPRSAGLTYRSGPTDPVLTPKSWVWSGARPRRE
jgi:hypothetical protein